MKISEALELFKYNWKDKISIVMLYDDGGDEEKLEPTLHKDIKVKPCPFCGESENIVLEEYEHTSGKRWKIYCCNCMSGIDRGYDQSPHGLIDAWNKIV